MHVPLVCLRKATFNLLHSSTKGNSSYERIEKIQRNTFNLERNGITNGNRDTIFLTQNLRRTNWRIGKHILRQFPVC